MYENKYAYTDYLLNYKQTNSNFRSEMQHFRNHTSVKEFITIIMKNDFIRTYWKKDWYFEAFYTLALLDYLTDQYHAKRFEAYNDIRACTLNDYAYPSSICVLQTLRPQKDIYKIAREECKNDPYGKYFYQYKIIEKEDDDADAGIFYPE